jgi:acetyl esterase/lipase
MASDDADRAVFLWPAGNVPGLAGSGPEAVTVNSRGERSIKEVHFPSIVPFLPAENSVVAPAAGLPAVLVIPGGGHSALAYDPEGTFVARWLAARGVAAFVLKHRLGRPEGISPYALHRPATAPDVEGHCILDTERAIRLIRSRAAEWGVDPTRVGAMGFSAGGECASWASMRPGLPNPSGKLPDAVTDALASCAVPF